MDGSWVMDRYVIWCFSWIVSWAVSPLWNPSTELCILPCMLPGGPCMFEFGVGRGGQPFCTCRWSWPLHLTEGWQSWGQWRRARVASEIGNIYPPQAYCLLYTSASGKLFAISSLCSSLSENVTARLQWDTTYWDFLFSFLKTGV